MKLRNFGGFVALLSFIICSSAAAQSNRLKAATASTSAEEKLIRSVYERLTEYSRAEALNGFRGNPEKLSADWVLQFELKNFRTGPIDEIRTALAKDLMTEATGDAIDLSRSTESLNGGPDRPIYRARWSTISQSTFVRPQWTIGDLIALQPEIQDIARYASYEVTVSYQGKSRTYNTLALFRDSNESTSNYLPEFFDVIGTCGNLSRVLEDSAKSTSESAAEKRVPPKQIADNSNSNAEGNNAGSFAAATTIAVDNRTKSVQIVSITPVGPPTPFGQSYEIVMRNVSAKNIDSYTLGQEDNGSSSADLIGADPIFPGGEFRNVLSLKKRVTVRAVTFSDGSVDGDAEAAKAITDTRQGWREQLERIVPLLQLAAKTGDLEKLKAQVRSLPEHGETNQSFHLAVGLASTRDNVLRSLQKMNPEDPVAELTLLIDETNKRLSQLKH